MSILEINHLMKTAKHSIMIESPYVTPTIKMLDYVNEVFLP